MLYVVCIVPVYVLIFDAMVCCFHRASTEMGIAHRSASSLPYSACTFAAIASATTVHASRARTHNLVPVSTLCKLCLTGTYFHAAFALCFICSSGAMKCGVVTLWRAGIVPLSTSGIKLDFVDFLVSS